jgi:hypothetical protein
MAFKKLRLWLSGCFECKHCGKNYHIMTFGYGQIICPDCYNGEKQFIFFDNTYWLNRILSILLMKDHRINEPETPDPLTIQPYDTYVEIPA